MRTTGILFGAENIPNLQSEEGKRKKDGISFEIPSFLTKNDNPEKIIRGNFLRQKIIVIGGS